MKTVFLRAILFFTVMFIFAVAFSGARAGAAIAAEQQSPKLPRLPGTKARNVVLIVADDHRYDAMSCAGHPFLQTPNLDVLARDGVRLRNAFVTTSLCSPSRASILTGLYAHRHRVIDNNNPVPTELTFFPQYLQSAGYETALSASGTWAATATSPSAASITG